MCNASKRKCKTVCKSKKDYPAWKTSRWKINSNFQVQKLCEDPMPDGWRVNTESTHTHPHPTSQPTHSKGELCIWIIYFLVGWWGKRWKGFLAIWSSPALKFYVTVAERHQKRSMNMMEASTRIIQDGLKCL